MFVKNRLLNIYVCIQLKIYKRIKVLSPALGEILEKDIKQKAEKNFLDISKKIKYKQ